MSEAVIDRTSLAYMYFRDGFRIADVQTGDVWHVKRHPERVDPNAPWPRDAA